MGGGERSSCPVTLPLGADMTRDSDPMISDRPGMTRCRSQSNKHMRSVTEINKHLTIMKVNHKLIVYVYCSIQSC